MAHLEAQLQGRFDDGRPPRSPRRLEGQVGQAVLAEGLDDPVAPPGGSLEAPAEVFQGRLAVPQPQIGDPDVIETLGLLAPVVDAADEVQRLEEVSQGLPVPPGLDMDVADGVEALLLAPLADLARGGGEGLPAVFQALGVVAQRQADIRHGREVEDVARPEAELAAQGEGLPGPLHRVDVFPLLVEDGGQPEAGLHPVEELVVGHEIGHGPLEEIARSRQVPAFQADIGQGHIGLVQAQGIAILLAQGPRPAGQLLGPAVVAHAQRVEAEVIEGIDKDARGARLLGRPHGLLAEIDGRRVFVEIINGVAQPAEAPGLAFPVPLRPEPGERAFPIGAGAGIVGQPEGDEAQGGQGGRGPAPSRPGLDLRPQPRQVLPVLARPDEVLETVQAIQAHIEGLLEGLPRLEIVVPRTEAQPERVDVIGLGRLPFGQAAQVGFDLVLPARGDGGADQEAISRDGSGVFGDEAAASGEDRNEIPLLQRRFEGPELFAGSGGRSGKGRRRREKEAEQDGGSRPGPDRRGGPRFRPLLRAWELE